MGCWPIKPSSKYPSSKRSIGSNLIAIETPGHHDETYNIKHEVQPKVHIFNDDAKKTSRYQYLGTDAHVFFLGGGGIQ